MATDTLLLLQVPPVVASLRVLIAPAQTDAVPVIALLDGNGLTVNNSYVEDVPQLLVTE